jgi:hypothetical protein
MLAPAMSESRDQSRVAVSAAGTVCFVVCYGIAIALYPGGTWWDRGAVGHSFTHNFLCDLMQSQALNGEPAPVGSFLARIGMAVMLVGLVAFYAQIARLETPISRAGRVAERAGLVACGLGFAVPIITSDLSRSGHLVAVVSAFLPSFVATIAAAIVCLRAPSVSLSMRAAAVVTLASGALDGFGYLFVYTSPALGLVPESVQTRIWIGEALPLLQRIATLGLIVWVAVTGAHTLQSPATTDKKRSPEASRRAGPMP